MRLFDKTQYKHWGSFLSFNTLWVLSIFGGILALDHLYIRSPFTFILKMILNVITLGTWWIYDALQVTFNSDSVKLFGLSMPVLGSGIGAGMFSSSETSAPSSSTHLHFLYYSIALIFGGIFGADSFILGNTKEGIIRLLMTLTAFLLPLSLIIYVYKLIVYFFKTESIINANWEYFGAPKPDTPYDDSFFPQWAFSIPLLNKILPYFDSTFNFIDKASKLNLTNTNSTEQFLKPVTNTVDKLVQPIVNTAIKPLTNIIGSTVQPIVSTIQTGENIIEDAIHVADKGINTIKTIGEGVLNTTKSLAELSGTALQLTSGISSDQLVNDINKMKSIADVKSMSGGNISENVTPLSLLFITTIAFITVSGFVISYRRSRQNEQFRSKEKDDTPPRPGIIGVAASIKE